MLRRQHQNIEQNEQQNKRINIFLDLDQTIISGEVLKDEDDDDEIYDIESNKTKAINFNFHNMENYYVIFERPGLQKFLDYLFKNFNVSVWTAASKDYGIFIAEKFILKGHPERKLDFMFFSYHCDLSEKIGKGTKDLSILWNYYKIPGYNENNTYIVDDYDHVFDTQQHNTIIAPPFRFNDKDSENDNFLPELVNRLKGLRKEMMAGDNRHSIGIINDGNEHK